MRKIKYGLRLEFEIETDNLNYLLSASGPLKIDMQKAFNQITKEDIVVDYIQQCENVFAKFNVLNPHVDDYPECLRKFLGRKIWRDTINAISTDEGKWSAGWLLSL